jgi:spore coat protein H
VTPPECEGPDSASFVEDFSEWSRGLSPGHAKEDTRDGDSATAAGPDPWSHAEEDGLPVLHLFMSSSLPDDDGYRPARLVYKGRCLLAETRYRVDTSLRFPKRSLTLDFKSGYTFDEPAQAGGFMGRRKLVLISPFNDNSYMRARLAFELWNRMSPDHLQMKAFSAVVYVNGEYHGLFTVTDHINQDFLSDRGLDPGGDLFKAVGGDANFSRLDATGLPKVKLHQGYEKKEGEPEDGDEAFHSIDALTAFVADATAERFLAERDAWFDSRDYEDWWIFAHLAYTKDSVAKNAYHFRARGPGTRFRYIPWDLDASFGQHWNTLRLDANDLYTFTNENRIFARLIEDPAISGPLFTRDRELLQGPLQREVVLGLVDAYATELRAAALKDEARWGAEYRVFPRWSGRTDLNDFEGEVAYLRGWVDARWQALEQQLR